MDGSNKFGTPDEHSSPVRGAAHRSVFSPPPFLIDHDDDVKKDEMNTSDSVDVIRFRVPPYAGNLKTWFLRLESQFRAERITSEATKFNVVVAQLPEKMLNSLPEGVVQNFAGKPNAYSLFKSHLMDLFLPTEDERLGKVLENSGVSAAEKPSEIFRTLN